MMSARHTFATSSLLMMIALGSVACQPNAARQDAQQPNATPPAAPESMPAATSEEAMAPQPEVPPGAQQATFGGGCFWCMEPPFEKLDGVYSVTSGYAGGPEQHPTYKQVSSGMTKQVEVVHVVFDPQKVSYNQLLDTYWRQIDPTQVNGQFADHGSQYRTVIFTRDEEQLKLAQASKKALEESKRFDQPIAVAIEPFNAFWPAENYHQDFYKKNPTHYKQYRKGSGREGYLARVWGQESH